MLRVVRTNILHFNVVLTGVIQAFRGNENELKKNKDKNAVLVYEFLYMFNGFT